MAVGKTLMIAGGEVNLPFAGEYIRKQGFDTVVCADSGLDAAFRLGLPVQYAMGDFDSASKEAVQYYRDTAQEEGTQTEFVEYPPEKDATDSEIVLDWITEKMPSEIYILGATGKRLDHFLANVNILMKPLSYGIPAYLIDGCNKIYLIDHSYVIQKKELFGTYISFLPLTEKAVVSLKGFRYGLDRKEMTIGNSLGVSNEIGKEEDAALVLLEEGILIVVESRDKEQGEQE
ncbi:MAG: thiamine diphosphokinase [Lachnospiraceae bacterium]|nr:thiamine diphosphokinase [Lachnospiraceae bacterium]